MQDEEVGTIVGWRTLYRHCGTDNDSTRAMDKSLFLLVGKEVAQREDHEEQQTYEETHLTQPDKVAEEVCQSQNNGKNQRYQRHTSPAIDTHQIDQRVIPRYEEHL